MCVVVTTHTTETMYPIFHTYSTPPHKYPHTFIPSYISTIPSHLHTLLTPSYPHTYPPYPHTFIPSYLHTLIPSYLHTVIPTQYANVPVNTIKHCFPSVAATVCILPTLESRHTTAVTKGRYLHPHRRYISFLRCF